MQEQLAEVEAKMKELEDSNGASFDNLNTFQQLGTAERCFDSLEKERSELHAKEAALQNQVRRHAFGGQAHVVAEVKRRRLDTWVL